MGGGHIADFPSKHQGAAVGSLESPFPIVLPPPRKPAPRT